MKEKFLIIDAMAVAYKAYFAFISRPLRNSAGENTSAVYGFTNQLLKVIEEYKPDYLAVATDSKEKTFRHHRYPLYKSSRSEMPEDMVPQIKRIFDIIDAMNIPLFIQSGYEADDLIGSAMKIAEKNGLESFAFTPDKDYIQLITENCKIIKPAKGFDKDELVDREKAIEEYSFEPFFMTDYLALVGDQSDDIPGVAGIGPKTATPLIQEFGTIENIYKNLDSLKKETIKNKLLAGKENAFLSKELATIITDIPLDFNLTRLKICNPDFEKIKLLFNELEFKNLYLKVTKLFDENIQSIKTETSISEEITEFSKEFTKYELINTPEKIKELKSKLIENGKFVFDTETDSLDTLNINLAGVAFSFKPKEAYFIPVNPFKENESLFSNDLSNRIPLTDFVENFKDVFENPQIKKICQNAKYDIAVLKTCGINVKGISFDTMLASYILNPDDKHNMDAMALKYLNYTTIPISQIIGEKKDASNIFIADLEKLKDYSCEDADITFRLYCILKQKLIDENLLSLAETVEFPLIEVLEIIERNGVSIDTKYLRSLSNELQKMLENYSKDIFTFSGIEFNINSTKQLQKILFEELKLNPAKKTKTGFSTDAQSLESMAGDHPIIPVLLNYRQVQKLKSTYVDTLPELIDRKTGRLHTNFNQTITSTGRLSSNNPNLQNIPIRTELGKEIRKAFTARDEEHIILSADYSQIELRIMASICQDEGLISAFNEGMDIHTSTASQVFMVPPAEVTSDMRRKAKEVNFGILYGIGAFGLSTRLGISQQHAKEIIETYFTKFSGVKNFIETAIENAKTKGYAETLLGRRRYLPNINSKNRAVRQFEERVATNMPIQGTAADMIKLAMIEVNKLMLDMNCRSTMILQVHDELVFEIFKPELDELKDKIITAMENAMKLNVPVKVEYGIGNNWLDAH